MGSPICYLINCCSGKTDHNDIHVVTEEQEVTIAPIDPRLQFA